MKLCNNIKKEEEEGSNGNNDDVSTIFEGLLPFKTFT